MRKSKLTVAIITRNEERNIKACIDAVRGWADEVIIVDGYSDDRTVSIARELGARVIEHRFDGSFATERNMGTDNASGEWVLHIDADDRVTDDFKKALDSVLDRDDGIDVYKFRRKSFFLGHFMEYGGWHHSVPNLVRRGKVRFEGVLHERPVFTGKMGEIEADIEHYPYESIAQFVERHNRYSTLEAQRLFAEKGPCREKEIRKNLLARSFKIFWKIYIKKKGRREGIYGLVFALLFAFMNFLIQAKYWELSRQNKKEEKR